MAASTHTLISVLQTVTLLAQVAGISAKLAPFELLAEPTMGGEDFSFIAEKACRRSEPQPSMMSYFAARELS